METIVKLTPQMVDCCYAFCFSSIFDIEHNVNALTTCERKQFKLYLETYVDQRGNGTLQAEMKWKKSYGFLPPWISSLGSDEILHLIALL